MSRFAKTAERAARAGGEILRDLLGQAQVWAKGPKDLVTEADLAAQRAIREILLGDFPDHDFIGEEDTPCAERNEVRARDLEPSVRGSEYRWIVDPLDGTANFVHQMPGFAVSIGLEQAGQIIAGVVFDPLSQECFSASRGAGAMLNGRPLRVSRCERLDEAMIAASFSPNVQRDSDEIARFVEMLVVCQGIRRLGSAALNLSYVAAGRLDGYWATGVKSWDVAAGVLIAQEAGAVLTNIDGRLFDLQYPRLAMAATPALHAELMTVLARAVAR